jgi:hypothetical protein
MAANLGPDLHDMYKILQDFAFKVNYNKLILILLVLIAVV